MLITPNDIGDALETLLREKFPGEEVYRELVPSEFTRPSSLIVQDGVEGDVDFGCSAVRMRATFTITTFVEVDAYYHSHLKPMHLRQMVIAGLFLPGYIRVENRAPKVVALALAGDYDYDTVTVTVSYVLDRSDFESLQQHPLMGELHMNEEV